MPAAQLAAEMLEGRAMMAANILQVSTMSPNGSYNAGDMITIAVDFDQPVAVIAGNPVLNLAVTNPNNVGGWALPAVFAGQNFSRTTMYFNYTVQPGDTSTNFDVILNPVGTAIQWGTISTVSDGSPADRDVTAADNTIVDLKTISIDTTAPAVPTVGYPTGVPGNINNPKAAALTINPIIYKSVPPNTLDARYGVLFGTYNLAAGAGETLRVTVNGATYAPLDVISQSATNVARQALVADGTTRIWAVDLINDMPVAGVPFAMNPWSTIDSQFYSVVATITDAAGNVSTDPSMNEVQIDMTAPFVANVTSPQGPGTYGVGSVIYVDVECSEPIYVRPSPIGLGGATPTLQLNITNAGGLPRFAAFDSIQSSGNLVGNVIRFKYTVLAGDSTVHLDYAAAVGPNVSALIVGGSSITDHAGNPINQTLVAPGAAGNVNGPSGGSLGFNTAIVIDTTAAVVTGVDAPAPWGVGGTTYTAVAGEKIPIRVVLSKQVVVTSNPTLALRVFDRNGLPVARTATFVNNLVAGGFSTLNFLYDVQPGDTTLNQRLDYLTTGALVLGAPGTIKDLGGNDLDLTLPGPGNTGSLGANNDIKIQAAPQVVNVKSLTPDGTYTEGTFIRLQVAFDQAVTVVGTPSLQLNGAIANAMAYYVGYTDAAGTAVAGPSKWLEFDYLVRPNDSTTGQPLNELDYTGSTALSVGTGAIYSLVTNTVNTVPTITQNNAICTLYVGPPGTQNQLGINNNIRIIVDTVAPAAPLVTLTNDTGAQAADGISNDGRVTVTFAEGRTDPRLPVTQQMRWQYWYQPQGGALVDSGVLTLPLGTAPFTGTFTLPVGTYDAGSVRAVLIDPTGNVSSPAGANGIKWVIDQSLPGALTASFTDTGISNADGITNNGLVTVTSGMEAGAQLVFSGNYSAAKNTLNPTPAAFTPVVLGQNVDTYTLAPGIYTGVTVQQRDLAGNLGPATPVNIFLVDTAIAGPTMGPLASNRIDYPITDLERFADVRVTVDGVDVFHTGYLDTTPAATPKGNWDLQIPIPSLPSVQLQPGMHTVTVVQTDLAGNTSTISKTVDAGIYASSNPLFFYNSPAGAAPAGATLPLMRLPVTTMTIKFNVAVQNFSIRSLKLLRNGVTINLTGATVAKVNSTTYVLTMPKSLTNLRGTYAVVVNGLSTSIKTLDGLATMNNKSYISWYRG